MAWNLVQSYPSVGSGLVYNGHGCGNFDMIISDHFSFISQLRPTPCVPCATLHLVTMLIEC